MTKFEKKFDEFFTFKTNAGAWSAALAVTFLTFGLGIKLAMVFGSWVN